MTIGVSASSPPSSSSLAVKESADAITMCVYLCVRCLSLSFPAVSASADGRKVRVSRSGICSSERTDGSLRRSLSLPRLTSSLFSQSALFSPAVPACVTHTVRVRTQRGKEEAHEHTVSSPLLSDHLSLTRSLTLSLVHYIRSLTHGLSFSFLVRLLLLLLVPVAGQRMRRVQHPLSPSSHTLTRHTDTPPAHEQRQNTRQAKTASSSPTPSSLSVCLEERLDDDAGTCSEYIGWREDDDVKGKGMPSRSSKSQDERLAASQKERIFAHTDCAPSLHPLTQLHPHSSFLFLRL